MQSASAARASSRRSSIAIARRTASRAACSAAPWPPSRCSSQASRRHARASPSSSPDSSKTPIARAPPPDGRRRRRRTAGMLEREAACAAAVRLPAAVACSSNVCDASSARSASPSSHSACACSTSSASRSGSPAGSSATARSSRNEAASTSSRVSARRAAEPRRRPAVSPRSGRPLVGEAELVPVAPGELELEADDLVGSTGFPRRRASSSQPEALVELGSLCLRQPRVRGVADEDVPEARDVVERQRQRRSRLDQALAREREEGRRDRVALGAGVRRVTASRQNSLPTIDARSSTIRSPTGRAVEAGVQHGRDRGRDVDLGARSRARRSSPPAAR